MSRHRRRGDITCCRLDPRDSMCRCILCRHVASIETRSLSVTSSRVRSRAAAPQHVALHGAARPDPPRRSVASRHATGSQGTAHDVTWRRATSSRGRSGRGRVRPTPRGAPGRCGLAGGGRRRGGGQLSPHPIGADLQGDDLRRHGRRTRIKEASLGVLDPRVRINTEPAGAARRSRFGTTDALANSELGVQSLPRDRGWGLQGLESVGRPAAVGSGPAAVDWSGSIED